MIGHPTDARFKQLVSERVLKDCPVTADDVTNAVSIFGPDLAGIRGKTVRGQPDRVETEFIPIPRDFYELHKFVTLTADVMFVNGIAFLTTLSRKIRMFTAEHIPTRTGPQLISSLTKVAKLYSRGGFIVRVILMDMEFEKVADDFDLIQVNTTAAREHVGEIERGIRVVKERARAVVSTLPYDLLHKQLVVHLIYFVVTWLNSFPAAQGISEKLSPREIVTQRQLSYETHCKAVFGSYVEAHDDHVITNTMKPRTRACIALGPSGNIQGTQKVFELSTGLVLKRRKIIPLPMPDSVIKKVTDWGRKSLKAQSTKTLKFLNRTKEAYAWENDEFNEDEDLVQQETIHPDLTANMPGIQLEEDLIDPPTAVQDEDLSDAEIAHAAAVNGGLSETPTQTTGVYNAGYDVATTADEQQENTEDTDPCFKEELQSDTEQLLEEDNDDSSVGSNNEMPDLINKGEDSDSDSDDDGDDDGDADGDNNSTGARRYPTRRGQQRLFTNVSHTNQKRYEETRGQNHYEILTDVSGI